MSPRRPRSPRKKIKTSLRQACHRLHWPQTKQVMPSTTSTTSRQHRNSCGTTMRPPGSLLNPHGSKPSRTISTHRGLDSVSTPPENISLSQGRRGRAMDARSDPGSAPHDKLPSKPKLKQPRKLQLQNSEQSTFKPTTYTTRWNKKSTPTKQVVSPSDPTQVTSTLWCCSRSTETPSSPNQ